MANEQAKVVALLNQKGGVGKTTMAFNMAHAFAQLGKKVLCLDLDPQANLSLLFGNRSQSHNIFHLLVNSVRELKSLHSPVLISDVIQTENGIDFIGSGQDLSGFELCVAGISAPRQLILKKQLEKNGLLDSYDYIIIDGPPTLGLLVVNILCACNGVLIPFQPDQFSRSGIKNFHDVLEQVEDMGVGAAPTVLGYIPNLVDIRRKQVGLDFAQIKQELEGLGQAPVYDGFPNKVQLVKASALGKTVFDYQSREYQELKQQFLAMAKQIEGSL